LLKLDEDEADEIACHMEHALPAHVLTRLVAFMDFIDCCPLGDLNWSTPAVASSGSKPSRLAQVEQRVLPAIRPELIAKADDSPEETWMG
jgi:hypothetical protein